MLAAMAETGWAGQQEEQVPETPPPTLDDSPTLSARSFLRLQGDQELGNVTCCGDWQSRPGFPRSSLTSAP